MATKLTQATVNRAMEEHPPGSQLYDTEVSGLRVVVGKRGCSYKFVGRIIDGTDRYISVVLGRTGDVALKSARERSTELRLALRRGEDPRTPKASVPTVAEALDRYLEGRTDLSPRTTNWYRQKIEGPLKSLAKLPADRVDNRRYHESLANLTPADVYHSRGAKILKMREEIKKQTIRQRRLQHQAAAA